MMKKVLALAVGLVLWSGCGASPAVMSPGFASSTSAVDSEPGDVRLAPGAHHVERSLGDNVAVDADVIVPDFSEAPTVDVGLVSFDSAKVQSVLFPDEQTSLETFPANSVLCGDQVMTSRDRDASCEFYSDDSVMMVSNLFFRTGLSDYVFNVVLWQPDDYGNNLALFSSEVGLPFASRGTALTAVVDAVKGLGLEFAPSGTAVYSLDHQTLQATQEQMIASGDYEGPKQTHWKSEWSVEDDCYFVVVDSAVDNIAVASFDTSSALEDRPFNGSQIRALYSWDGLEYLAVSQLYSVKSTAAPMPLVPVEDAITTVGAKFGSLITAAKYKIGSAALVYVPRFKDNRRGSVQLVPSWHFVVHELYTDPQTGSTVDHRRHILVNAQTGKEM